MSVDINWLAIGVGTLVSMFTGFIWYHPQVFGTTWMKAIGLTKKQQEKNQNLAMATAVVRSFLLAFTLFHLIFIADVFYVESSFLEDALKIGLVVGVTISAATLLMHETFENRPMVATKIHTIFEVVNTFLVAGAIGLVAG